MITGLKKNKFTQKLATGAAALGVLAGVGLAGAPAQAGVFTLTPLPTPPQSVTQDSEWGLSTPPSPGDEAIWSTWPAAIAPGTGIPAGSNAGEGCRHGLTQCVNGWDNPLITKTPGSMIKFNYYGSGTATQTNNLFWDANGNGIGDPGESIFGSSPGIICDDGQAPDNVFGSVCKMSAKYTVPANGILPILFTTNLPAPNNVTPNGEPVLVSGTNVTGAHYFATIDGTWATLTGNMVFVGFSDGNGGTGTGDDDAADFVVKIENVPEPGTVLGLLAVGGLGAFMKRKKQG